MTNEELKQKERRIIEINRMLEELASEKALLETELLDSAIGAEGDVAYNGELIKIVNKTSTKKEINKTIAQKLLVSDSSLLRDLKKYISLTSPVTVIKILETEYPEYIEENPDIIVSKTSTKAEVVIKATSEISVETEDIDLF